MGGKESLFDYRSKSVVLHAVLDDDQLTVLKHLDSLLANNGVVNSGSGSLSVVNGEDTIFSLVVNSNLGLFCRESSEIEQDTCTVYLILTFR